MTKVKVFAEKFVHTIERRINEWVEEQMSIADQGNEDFEIKDVKYFYTDKLNGYSVVLVIYKISKY